jgi:catechol 2,3-dioxygenase-like lactoylglutathione lyase family enzyme
MSLNQTNSATVTTEAGASSGRLVMCAIADDGEGGYTIRELDPLEESAALALADADGFTVNDGPDNPTDLAQMYFVRAASSDVISTFE